MPLNTQVIPKSQITAAFVDYAGSPASVTIPAIVVDSITVPRVRQVADGNVMVNSAAGAVLYATPVYGLAPPQSFSMQFLTTDPTDNSEVTAILALFRALYNNSVAGTAYSGYTFTSQLTGGGKLEGKLVLTEADEAANVFVTTVPCKVTGVEDGAVDRVSATTVTFEVTGAITFS